MNMKKISAKIALILFVAGLLAIGLQACDDSYADCGDYGNYGDPYGGGQLP